MPDQPLEILVVDDSPEDRATYQRYLTRDPAQAYQIHEARGVEDGLRQLASLKPACIILDYAMPDGTGLDFLHEMHKAGRVTPVIMLTGTGDESVAVEAMKSGARDYLVKQRLNAESLRVAIAGALYRDQAENQMKQQRLELERLYREAQDAHLAKDVLVTQLQEANTAKDRFLATLSHELRTPLTPILLAIHSLDESQLNEEMRDLFETIERNVALEARLIDDLLDLTRVSKGKLQLDVQIEDVHALLRDVLEICRSDLESKSFTLELIFAANESRVVADKARLQQVFWNLLKNAAKFTPLGGHITIATRNPSPDRVTISVTDNGLGIPAERLPKIFDAFEQGGPAVTQTYGGLGLGLAISKAVVDAHEGTLRAESPGAKQGSTFTVELAVSTATPTSETSHPAGSDEHSATVLLVEDHEDSARLLARALRRAGFEVLTANSVASALDVFQTQTVDVLVSDLGLPDGHGIDLLREINSIRPVKAIALSGYGFERDVEATRQVGFLAHLVKPVEPLHLRRTIARILNGAGSTVPNE